jgi:hypothetical protein
MRQIFDLSFKLLTETITPRNTVKFNKSHGLAVGDDIKFHPSEASEWAQNTVDGTTTKSKSEEMV